MAENFKVGASKIRIFLGFFYFAALMACQANAPKEGVRPSSSPFASFNPYPNTLNSTLPTYTPVPMATLDPSIAANDAYRQQQLDQQRQASQTAGLLSFLSCSTRSSGGGAGASAAGLGNLLGCASQGLMTSLMPSLGGGLTGGYGGFGSMNGYGNMNGYNSLGGYNSMNGYNNMNGYGRPTNGGYQPSGNRPYGY